VPRSRIRGRQDPHRLIPIEEVFPQAYSVLAALMRTQILLTAYPVEMKREAKLYGLQPVPWPTRHNQVPAAMHQALWGLLAEPAWNHPIRPQSVTRSREHREVAEGIQVWVDNNMESAGDIIGRVWGTPVGRTTAVLKAMSARQPISTSLIDAARGGRLARLGIGKTHRRPVAQFSQFALNAAALTCPEKVGEFRARLAVEPMPDIMRAVLDNSALADVHDIAVGE